MKGSTILLMLVVACGSEAANPGFLDALDEECAALSIDECRQPEARCVMSSGAKYDAEEHCIGPMSSFGCRSGIACGDGNSVLAEDEDGAIWHFPWPCPPPEWRRVLPTNPAYDGVGVVPNWSSKAGSSVLRELSSE